MEISPHRLVPLLSIFIIFGFASSLHISHDALETHAAATSRSLLQAKLPCKEDFANKNYSIITSKCKGPNYQPSMCCNAFKEFACPLTQFINDDKTDCATTMFSYINLYGRYPPGIFANMCKEGKDGLDCSNVTAAAAATSSSAPPASPFSFTSCNLFCFGSRGLEASPGIWGLCSAKAAEKEAAATETAKIPDFFMGYLFASGR